MDTVIYTILSALVKQHRHNHTYILYRMWISSLYPIYFEYLVDEPVWFITGCQCSTCIMLLFINMYFLFLYGLQVVDCDIQMKQ